MNNCASKERFVPADLPIVQAGGRYRVIAAGGVPVRDGNSPAAKVVHHLPQGAIVVCAEAVFSSEGAQHVRVSSPAGWLTADGLEPAPPAPTVKLDFATFQKRHEDVAAGDRYGLKFPFTLDQLQQFGAGFLTEAFKAAGSMSPDNCVTDIVALDRLFSVGASENAFLTVAYAKPEAGLHTNLFVKCPPNKEVEYKYELSAMSHGEVEMQRLARSGILPFATAKYYYGDFASETCNYILITERINYSVPPIEPAYKKGYDHLVPEVEEHYRVLAAALAGLVAAQKTGALGCDVEQIFPFARAARDFQPIPHPERNVDKLVDFIGRIAPQLFVKGASDPTFLRQWREDLLFGLTHKDAVIAYLHEDVDYTGLCHPNLNLDNAWFWRDAEGALKVGLIDWGGAGQMSIAQALSGMLMMPIPELHLKLVRQTIDAFIDEHERRGGLRLDREKLLFHYKASVFSTAICTIIAFVVDMLFQFSEEEYATMVDRFDRRLLDSGLYAAIIWIDNMLRDWLDELTPGDACRRIVERDNSVTRETETMRRAG
jgi:hypothetical protein